MKRRGRAIAITTVAVGVAVMVTVAVTLRGPILEEWYLKDLVVYDAERSKEAAEWLGRHGSGRAMRRLFDVARELANRPDAEDLSKDTCNSIVRVCQALESIAVRQRREVVPILVTVLKEKPPRPIPGNEVRIGAANLLAKICPDAREAIPVLRQALNDGEERFRNYVAKALKRIEGESADAGDAR